MKTLAEIPNLFNRSLLSTDGIPEWLKREIFVLEHVEQMLGKDHDR